MEIEAAMNQMVNVPISLLYGSFICGALFFFILDGLSGVVSILITKAIEKIKKKKEKEKENGSNNS